MLFNWTKRSKLYGFLSFDKNISNTLSKNLSIKQKYLDHAKHFATDKSKTTSKTVIQKSDDAIKSLIKLQRIYYNIIQRLFHK